MYHHVTVLALAVRLYRPSLTVGLLDEILCSY